MWWEAKVAPGESAGRDAGRVVVRTGATAVAATVQSIDNDGTRVTLLGHCPASSSDLRELARAVSRGSTSAMTDLPGSYTAIAETPAGDVWFAGDLAGQSCVFYGQDADGSLLVASHAWRVAAALGATLNRDWLALRLLAPGAVDTWQSGTPWGRVAAVRPAWTLRAGPDGAVVPTPPGRVADTIADLDQAADRLRDALDRGTRSRVHESTRPTADLSGGLDSSTICALGARVAPLDALTVTASGVSDAEYAAALTRGTHQLRQHVAEEPGDALPYTNLTDVPRLDEPAPCLAVLARERWWLDTITELGSDLHLSGDGGDGVLTAPPAYLADLATRAAAGRLWRHARGWARLRHRAPSAVIRAALALRRTSYPDTLRAAGTRIVDGSDVGNGWERLVSWLGPGGVVPWGTEEAREVAAHALHDHANRHAGPVVPSGFGVGDAVAWMALTAFARGQRAYTDLAADRGVNHHAPFLDNQVVRACWSVPAAVRTTPEQAKPLLWRAMRDIVPPVVLNRSDKGDYTAWHYRGLRASANTLDDLLASSLLGELDLIDIPALRAELHRARAGLPIRLGAFDTVLSTELWLRAHHAPSPAPEVIDRATPTAA